MDKPSVRARVRMPSKEREGKRALLWAELRKKWHLYLFILPTFVFLIVFRYYPAGSAIYHAFTKWNGAGMSMTTTRGGGLNCCT